MKILIDINHPAHVQFFKNPVRILQGRGHDVLLTSREKEMTVELLDRLGLPHRTLSALGRHGAASLAWELVSRTAALRRVVRRFRPQVLAAVGGTFAAWAGRLTGTPSVVFYDTENAVLQNAITYPLASCVVAPRCYEGRLPAGRHVRYDGYHELSYLRPGCFTPDRGIALSSGLAPEGDTFFVRLVSWRANHDIGEKGWPGPLLERVVRSLEARGKVLISSEAPLPEGLEGRRYAGGAENVHHVMAHCRAYVGESATMASECAVLGVPAVYVSRTGRGYTNEQERRYGLVANVHRLRWPPVESAIERILAEPAAHWRAAGRSVLVDTIDVAAFAAGFLERFARAMDGRSSGGAAAAALRRMSTGRPRRTP